MNGKKLRYDGLKGCTDYKKAVQIIKDGGYATRKRYFVIGFAVVVIAFAIVFAPKIEASVLEMTSADKSDVSGNISEIVYFTIDTTDKDNAGKTFTPPFVRIVSKNGSIMQVERSTQAKRTHQMLGVYRIRITENHKVIYSSDYWRDESITIKLKENRRYEGTIYAHPDVCCVYSNVLERENGRPAVWDYKGFETLPSYFVEANKCKVMVVDKDRP